MNKLKAMMGLHPNMPEFVLFGDSLTDYAFDEHTQGFGLELEKRYKHKALILNEGKIDPMHRFIICWKPGFAPGFGC